MDLYTKKLNLLILKNSNLAIKILIFNIDNVFFLGIGEFNSAINLHNEKKSSILCHFL